jgi:hypothetical protein
MSLTIVASLLTTTSLISPVTQQHLPQQRVVGAQHRCSPLLQMMADADDDTAGQGLMAADDDYTAGQGFGKSSANSNAAAEERGRKALEALKASAGSAKGYDSSLQGLRGSEPEEPVEVPQEFKDTVVYGFAGFLILGGFISLFVGGSLWEPKGFNEDGTPPSEQVASSTQSAPAFGFVPTAREREQVNEAIAP